MDHFDLKRCLIHLASVAAALASPPKNSRIGALPLNAEAMA
jgi:hypothetical protein